MQITKVQYGKTYSLGNYCSERIDLEASIDETTETVADSIFQLRHYCDEIHKKNNPQLYQEQTPIANGYTNDGKEWTANGKAEISISQPEEKISPEQEIENTLKDIEEATAETILTFRLPAAQNQKTMGAFNRRKKQLNIP